MYMIQTENHPNMAVLNSPSISIIYGIMSPSLSTFIWWGLDRVTSKPPKSARPARPAFSFICVARVVLRIQNGLRVIKFKIKISPVSGLNHVRNFRMTKFFSKIKWIARNSRDNCHSSTFLLPVLRSITFSFTWDIYIWLKIVQYFNGYTWSTL